MNSSAPLLLVFEEWRGRLSKHGKFGFMSEAELPIFAAVPVGLAPCIPELMSKICSVYGPVWTGLYAPSV